MMNAKVSMFFFLLRLFRAISPLKIFFIFAEFFFSSSSCFYLHKMYDRFGNIIVIAHHIHLFFMDYSIAVDSGCRQFLAQVVLFKIKNSSSLYILLHFLQTRTHSHTPTQL